MKNAKRDSEYVTGSEYTKVLNEHVNFDTIAYNSRTSIFLYMRLHLLKHGRMWLCVKVRLHFGYYNIWLPAITLAESQIQRRSQLFVGISSALLLWTLFKTLVLKRATIQLLKKISKY